MAKLYDLNSSFELEEHKKHYIDYLEVIIAPDGTVNYAVPSHQIYLERYLARLKNISIKELSKLCPKEYYADYTTWLLNETNCVSVWSIGYMIPENGVTKIQQNVLDKFIEENLMIDKQLNL